VRRKAEGVIGIVEEVMGEGVGEKMGGRGKESGMREG